MSKKCARTVELVALITLVVACAACVSHMAGQVLAEIPVKETLGPDGNSIIEVFKPDGMVAVEYSIAWIPHHHPAADENDEVIQQWLKWRFGAFLCFNINQFSGKEFCRIDHPKRYDPANWM